GQRKGLGLGGGPWFVIKKDVTKNPTKWKKN
ncbi:MAG: tRNA methyl transferase PRC-barrel domain-containing protein, partial [Capnocytophaga leadbetteri]